MAARESTSGASASAQYQAVRPGRKREFPATAPASSVRTSAGRRIAQVRAASPIPTAAPSATMVARRANGGGSAGHRPAMKRMQARLRSASQA